MMKLLLIGLTLIAFPLITWWAEERDPDYYAVIRMADRDRKAQAARRPARTLNHYAVIGKAPATLARCTGADHKIH